MSQGEAPLVPGQIVDGKYHITKVIGQGGIGIVAAAEHLMLKHRVALKVLRPELCTNATHRSRFIREARAAVQLESEHVARVMDVGTMGSGMPFLVMEYLEGQSLSTLLAQRGPLPPVEAVRYIMEACDGIAEAHSLGIVHRDIKPANLFLALGRDGTWKVRVLDFGIAKAAASVVGSVGAITQSSGFLGSPRYMSPEQMQSSRDVDVRTDIWSLGVTLYELVAGVPPFDAPARELHKTVMHVRPLTLDERVAQLPAGFSQMVMRCLSKDARDRYTNIQEFARALAPYAPADTQAKLPRILRWPAMSAHSARLAARPDVPASSTFASSSPPSAYGPGAPLPAPVSGANQVASTSAASAAPAAAAALRQAATIPAASHRGGALTTASATSRTRSRAIPWWAIPILLGVLVFGILVGAAGYWMTLRDAPPTPSSDPN